ncbi:helix-turn-helix transcriptional regulator [Hominibacterium faecale]|uniref:helix-turn-helix transcriptional regulator n=1 Tax=Hominibacterium faecale TaxID=2839743 RepID=UPI0022B2A1C6|nr:helix-turn-helix transcriptional regulator [Hominibacterium faecale]
MNFGEQIKKLRADEKLTQQKMADELGVTRQAISNWENNKNLPDIEMIIIIAKTFHLTLDELILGGKEMNNMTQKLINDGSENKRVQLNFKTIKIGFTLILVAFLSLVVGIFVPVQMENLMVDIFYLALLGSAVAFGIAGIKNVKAFLKRKKLKK